MKSLNKTELLLKNSSIWKFLTQKDEFSSQLRHSKQITFLILEFTWRIVKKLLNFMHVLRMSPKK